LRADTATPYPSLPNRDANIWPENTGNERLYRW